MAEISVRVLGEEDWQVYRDLRLSALKESPGAFVAGYDEESAYDEQLWRDRMVRAHRLAAESDGGPVGTVCLGVHEDEPDAGEVFGLWVAPEARGTGVAWKLVRAGAARAAEDGRKRLYFWVGTEDGRAVAFASSFGFRPTADRRQTRVASEMDGDTEIAMVLPMSGYPQSSENPLHL